MPGSLARRRGSFAAAGLIGLCTLAVSPARAADDGYANVFSSVLGSVGIIRTDAPPPIEYRERPPLVLPKDAALPKPVSGGIRHSAAWPQDPDVLKRRKEADEARAPHTMGAVHSDKGEIVSAQELARGRAAESEPVRPNDCGNDGQGHNCTVLSPEVLKAEGDHYRAANPEKRDTLVAGQEPSRDFLTQPPKGYLKPVKAVKATTEAPEEKVDDSSARYMQQQEAKKRAAEE
ncbi:hypothetical protein [Lichenibacterium ramalinae]|uniref:Uncharacterized protein n=1 Tax=Lichenibacterium ramalinae TaxID=2316527 RepID=A0A4Q2RGB1_9HYPH|nr:hypothetical protein [Lichenibacterium ramalinae]RYB06455.1 hypothetical protein D3272_06850 [Lichenibacterium ramalinae]